MPHCTVKATMDLCLDTQTARMSVGEFASFSQYTPTTAHGLNPKARMEQGRLWHQKAANEISEGKTEYPLSASFNRKGWNISLHGRLDQLIPQQNGTLVREVKTTTCNLPISHDSILKNFPHYCLQAVTYACILKSQSPETRYIAELLLISILTEETQYIQLDTQQETLFEKQLDRLAGFLEKKKSRLLRFKDIPTGAPYASLREGQRDTLGQLRSVSSDTPFVLLEAPTGFGKTGLIIDHALEELKSGKIDQVIYTTGKSTGQLPVLQQLNKLFRAHSNLHYLQLRSHEELAINSPLHTCTSPFDGCLHGFLPRIQEIGLTEEDLFAKGNLIAQNAQKLAIKHGLCPHMLLLHALKWAPFWVCDYNYVFSSTQRGLLEHHGQLSPRRTLLIVDEAHNLSSRVEQNLSGTLSTQSAIDVYEFLETYECSQHTLRSWQWLIDHLSALHPTDALSPNEERSLKQAFEQISNTLPNITNSDIPNNIVQAVEEALHINARMHDSDNSYHIWVSSHGQVRIDCVSAAKHIAKYLSPFKSTIFASATLSPIESFQEDCGISPLASASIQGHAPWKTKAYSFSIDTRVDTRFRSRAQFYNTTTSTISLAATRASGPIAAFFPSYRYAQEIASRLDASYPWLRVALQNRSETTAQQIGSIYEAAKNHDILLLVLGSSFSEGIDLLGDLVQTAVIVGPALPEVNPVQQARLNNLGYLGREQAFYRTYTVSGMKKINQALGRLVRKPGQTAKVILHCERFAEPSFKALLPLECQSASILRTEADLELWLES